MQVRDVEQQRSVTDSTHSYAGVHAIAARNADWHIPTYVRMRTICFYCMNMQNTISCRITEYSDRSKAILLQPLSFNTTYAHGIDRYALKNDIHVYVHVLTTIY